MRRQADLRIESGMRQTISLTTLPMFSFEPPLKKIVIDLAGRLHDTLSFIALSREIKKTRQAGGFLKSCVLLF
jgi:hypothetical protein